MLSWRAGRGTLRLRTAQHMGTLELWVSAGERREMRRGEKYSHQESRSRNTTRVQILWKKQGLETLPFHKTARTGSDSWLQLLGKQGNRSVCKFKTNGSLGHFMPRNAPSSLLSHTVTCPLCSQSPALS